MSDRFLEQIGLPPTAHGRPVHRCRRVGAGVYAIAERYAMRQLRGMIIYRLQPMLEICRIAASRCQNALDRDLTDTPQNRPSHAEVAAIAPRVKPVHLYAAHGW